ncbi:hypothetical protein RI129_000708 [Pyrocoelia pectoralis]|uniref:Retinoid-inducible serine carboxypeptidase n=1 Tax=Pyrocoelia pectoralis TaxID=417401 RepID=A0AAN7VTW5_9COLE
MQIIITCIIATSRQGFGPGQQDWDYVEVRSGAYEFWWLYETTAQVVNVTEKPLVIWLQGGPGSSSTGFGNLAEIGPLDENLNTRSHTWVKDVNLLFIDNPVGTGYSYVDKETYLTRTNKQIANDLVTCMNGFYKKRPEFRNVSLYITSQSYGGKMAAQFALELYKKGFENIKGVNLIDPWISPINSVLHWAPFLLNVGAIDKQGYKEVDASAKVTQKHLKKGLYLNATYSWAYTQQIIMSVTKNINFYNILKKVNSNYEVDTKIGLLMNGKIKEALKLNVTWGSQSGIVFRELMVDFMKPVIHIGTIAWVDSMKWSRSNEWPSVPRTALSVNGINEGYQKKLGQFAVYWVTRAGHEVPADNPIAMDRILKDLIN